MITALTGFTQRPVTANGISINAVTGGAGPPILLLHGWPETWWEWHKVMPLLAERFSVVAIDLRGAGFSDCPQGGYDKATMARDAHGVMAALGHEQYAVCGHDIGGMVALAHGRRHNHRCSPLAPSGRATDNARLASHPAVDRAAPSWLPRPERRRARSGRRMPAFARRRPNASANARLVDR